MSNMICEFKGRNESGEIDLNFLLKEDKVYVMDNHRAAMWCWIQEISRYEHVRLLHIDRHYDTKCADLETELLSLPESFRLSNLTIQDYLELKDGQKIRPLIRWDNYIPLFLVRYSQKVTESIFITHDIDDYPPFKRITYKTKMQDIPDNLEDWMDRGDHDKHWPWIVNIDIDYFVFDRNGRQYSMFSVEYLEAVFEAFSNTMKSGKVACITIALSPECSGGWELAEELTSRACKKLGFNFALPK
jgi:UPF0489 domain